LIWRAFSERVCCVYFEQKLQILVQSGTIVHPGFVEQKKRSISDSDKFLHVFVLFSTLQIWGPSIDYFVKIAPSMVSAPLHLELIYNLLPYLNVEICPL